MSTRLRYIIRTACASAALALLPSESAAQGNSEEHATPARAHVVVALVDKLPDNYTGAVILRQATGRGNVILMTIESATARQLTAAVLTLTTVFEVDGVLPTKDATIKVGSRQPPRAWRDSEAVRAEGIVRQLKRTHPRYVPGVGKVPFVNITVSTTAMKGKLTKTAGAGGR